jgi:hypothetical protein
MKVGRKSINEKANVWSLSTYPKKEKRRGVVDNLILYCQGF